MTLPAIKYHCRLKPEGGELKLLARHLRFNFWFYLLVLLTLGLGVMAGAMQSPLTMEADDASKLISQLTDSGSSLTLVGCLINQLPWWLSLSFLGLTVIGALLILPVIFFKGYCIGYTIYTLARANGEAGIWFALTAVLPHNLVYIPCLLVMSVAAIRFTGVLFGVRDNKSGLLTSLFTYLVTVLLAGGGLVLGGVLECWVTPWLLHWW